MKILIILIIVITSIKLYAQNNNWVSNDIYSSGVKASSPNICFINANTGYTVLTFHPTSNYFSLFKTTNGGINWFYSLEEFTNTNHEGTPNVFFLNENIGFVTNHYFSGSMSYINLWKTTNAGVSWQPLNTINSNTNGLGYSVSRIKFINNNTGFINTESQIFKTTDGGNHFYVKLDLYDPNNTKKRRIDDFEINDAGIIYAGGQVDDGHYKYPMLYKSTDYGENFNAILDGGQNLEMGVIQSLCFHMNNELILLTQKADESYHFYKYTNNDFTQLTSFDEQYIHTDICSTPSGDLYASEFSKPIWYSDPIHEYVYRSSDIGNTWIKEFDLERPYAGYSMNQLNNIKDIVSYSVMNYNNNLIYRVRDLDMLLKIYAETTPITGRILSVNGSAPIEITQPEGYPYPIKGGIATLNAELDNGTDKIFYKWNDNSVNSNNQSYYLDTKGEISAIYKTKNISTDANAISNVSQTKSFRDSVDMGLYEIHQSIGGIFYSHNITPNGELTREFVVNGGELYSSQFPNDKTADGNKNPSICRIRHFGSAQQSLYDAYLVAATWERYNIGNNKEQIFGAIRVNSTGNPFLRYGTYPNDPNGKNSGILREFDAPNGFDSKPEIIAAFYHSQNTYDDHPYDYFYIIPHLEHVSNGNKLAVTVRYKNCSAYEQNPFLTQPQDNTFILEPDNVFDYAVEGSQFDYVTNVNQPYFYLHFAYKKGDDILYRREKFILNFSNDPPTIDRYYDYDWIQNGSEYYFKNLSEASDVERVSPDISLKNGKPIVTYRGKILHKEIVHYEEGEDQLFAYDTYPVYVKSQINNTSWGETTSYSSTLLQNYPDVEGSKDAGAYIVNFQRSNLFKKFVKVDYANSYLCNPEDFYGSDSKIAKGSYRGTTGASSHPTLLTLSYPGNAQYIIGVQNFTISNASISTNEDGFSNLSGSIAKNNANYIYNLGPIFVSNTVCGFKDDNPSITIHNPVDFNDNMKSKGFYLSDNDTLIIGAMGYYKPIDHQLSVSMKYHVNLVTKSTNQIFKELFRDTVKVKDSINLEFLRGYIIKGISNGSDSFYVQLLVDPNDAISDSYDLCGVYQDPGVEGDNISRYKTKVFFENESLHNNIVNNIPKIFELSQNYPNPFNPTTTIKYALPKNEFVTIKIYDIAGREIMQLVNEYKQAGYHSVNFNGGNMASGVYFYRIQAGEFKSVKRMLMIK
jgi:flagellar hook assembly protein FlgD